MIYYSYNVLCTAVHNTLYNSQAVICPLLMASLSTSSVKMEICPWFSG